MEFESLVQEELTALVKKLADLAATERVGAVDAAVAQVRSEAEAGAARLQSETTAALERAREEFAARLTRAEAEALASIDEARASAQDELSRALGERDSAIETMRREHDARLAEARAEQDAALLTAQATHQTALLAAQAERDAALSAARAEHDSVLSAIRADYETTLFAARAEAEGDGSKMRADLAAETLRIREMADAAIADAQLTAAGEVAQARTAAELSAARAQAAETELVAVRAAASAAARTSGTFGEMVEKLRDRQAQLAAENERLAAENAAYSYERQELLDKTDSARTGPSVARLASTFERVSTASALDAVLSSAATGLAEGFSRVAVFEVRDNRLLPGFHRGFDANSGLDKVVIPLGVDSFMSTAAHTREPRILRGPSQTAAAPFGGSPQLVVTAAVAAHGETVAVLYLDDSGLAVSPEAADERLAQAQVVLAFTTARLDRLTAEMKAAAELRAYAQMLVDEAEYVHQADISAKKPDAERTTRLAENVRCARQIYRQRVAVDGPAAAGLLEEVLKATVEARAATTFGRELQKAIGGAAAGAQRAAQAS